MTNSLARQGHLTQKWANLMMMLDNPHNHMLYYTWKGPFISAHMLKIQIILCVRAVESGLIQFESRIHGSFGILTAEQTMGLLRLCKRAVLSADDICQVFRLLPSYLCFAVACECSLFATDWCIKHTPNMSASSRTSLLPSTIYFNTK